VSKLAYAVGLVIGLAGTAAAQPAGTDLSLPHYTTEQTCPAAIGDINVRFCVLDEQRNLDFLQWVWDGLSVETRSDCRRYMAANTADNRPGIYVPNLYKALAGCVAVHLPLEVQHHGPTQLR
jgi:hypothetical protein